MREGSADARRFLLLSRVLAGLGRTGPWMQGREKEVYDYKSWATKGGRAEGRDRAAPCSLTASSFRASSSTRRGSREQRR